MRRSARNSIHTHDRDGLVSQIPALLISTQRDRRNPSPSEDGPHLGRRSGTDSGSAASRGDCRRAVALARAGPGLPHPVPVIPRCSVHPFAARPSRSASPKRTLLAAERAPGQHRRVASDVRMTERSRSSWPTLMAMSSAWRRQPLAHSLFQAEGNASCRSRRIIRGPIDGVRPAGAQAYRIFSRYPLWQGRIDTTAAVSWSSTHVAAMSVSQPSGLQVVGVAAPASAYHQRCCDAAAAAYSCSIRRRNGASPCLCCVSRRRS